MTSRFLAPLLAGLIFLSVIPLHAQDESLDIDDESSSEEIAPAPASEAPPVVEPTPTLIELAPAPIIEQAPAVPPAAAAPTGPPPATCDATDFALTYANGTFTFRRTSFTPGTTAELWVEGPLPNLPLAEGEVPTYPQRDPDQRFTIGPDCLITATIAVPHDGYYGIFIRGPRFGPGGHTLGYLGWQALATNGNGASNMPRVTVPRNPAAPRPTPTRTR